MSDAGEHVRRLGLLYTLILAGRLTLLRCQNYFRAYPISRLCDLKYAWRVLRVVVRANTAAFIAAYLGSLEEL